MSRLSDRARVIADVERQHITPAFPRGQLSLIVAGSGLAGFFTSVTLLHAGMASMGIRYAVAVLGAYLGFLGLLRLWIAWQRGWVPDLDVVGDGRTASSAETGVAQHIASGGRSGGAGGGGRWAGDTRPLVSTSRPGTPGGSSGGRFGGLDIDLDDGWWLLLAAVLVCGGALAVAYVIYIAPLLLAEVAVDAAVVTTMYKRLKPHDVQHWSVGVVRQTWIPVLVLTLCLAGAGFALQQVAPEARSIGGVIAHLQR